MIYGRAYHNQKQILLVVKTIMHLDDEWISATGGHPLEDRLLCEGVLELLMGEDMSLRDSLEGKEIAG